MAYQVVQILSVVQEIQVAESFSSRTQVGGFMSHHEVEVVVEACESRADFFVDPQVDSCSKFQPSMSVQETISRSNGHRNMDRDRHWWKADLWARADVAQTA